MRSARADACARQAAGIGPKGQRALTHTALAGLRDPSTGPAGAVSLFREQDTGDDAYMSGEDTREDRFRAGESVSWRGMTANLALVAFKLVAGIIGRSSAMVADAAHSASDMLATFGVIVAFRISKRPADEDHPYGHGKAEPVAAKLVGAILIVAGSGIAVEAVRRIIARDFRSGPADRPNGRSRIIHHSHELIIPDRSDSPPGGSGAALMAEALHHRSDALLRALLPEYRRAAWPAHTGSGRAGFVSIHDDHLMGLR